MSLKKGKVAEAYVWMRLLQHGPVPYVPLADIEGADLVVRTADKKLVKLQVKSRGFALPKTGGYGYQIKNLWRGENTLAFDYLVIVLPQNNPQEHEAWVVPKREVRRRLTPRGDLNLTLKLLRQEWKKYHEQWNL
ncbi:MAG: hypothetical protein V3U90_07940 [Dehalococcoidia bacterium]